MFDIQTAPAKNIQTKKNVCKHMSYAVPRSNEAKKCPCTTTPLDNHIYQTLEAYIQFQRNGSDKYYGIKGFPTCLIIFIQGII